MKIIIALIIEAFFFGIIIYVLFQKFVFFYANALRDLEKMNQMKNVYSSWLDKLQNGRTEERFFLKNNYINVVVYGMGELGQTLCKGLKHSNHIKVVYGLDKNCGNIVYQIPIYKMEDAPILESIDVIIVTVIGDYEKILKQLQCYYACKIIYLEDIIEYL